MEKIDVVMVTYNRLDFTKLAIDNIINKGGVPVRFIFTDAGSTDGTPEWLKENFTGKDKDNIVITSNEKTPLGDNLTKAVPYIKSDPFMTTSEDQVSHQDNFIGKLVDILMNSPYWAIRPRLYKENPDLNERLRNKIDEEYKIIKTSAMLCNYRLIKKKVLSVLGNEFHGHQKESRAFAGKLGRKLHGIAKDVIMVDLGEYPGRGYVKNNKPLNPLYIKYINQYIETGHSISWESDWRKQYLTS